MFICDVVSAQWNGLVVTLKVRDDNGAESEIRVSPSARPALLLELLGCPPGASATDRVTFAPVGIATGVAEGANGCVLQFLLPDNRSLRIFIPDEGLKMFKERIAALNARRS